MNADEFAITIRRQADGDFAEYIGFIQKNGLANPLGTQLLATRARNTFQLARTAFPTDVTIQPTIDALSHFEDGWAKLVWVQNMKSDKNL